MDAPRKRRASSVPWTQHEDSMLAELATLGGLCWRRVADSLGTGRTPDQCCQRWHRVLMPTIRKGRWTPDEDRRLLECVARCGVGNWAAIAREFPTRTDNQIRAHYARVLKHPPYFRPGLRLAERDWVPIVSFILCASRCMGTRPFREWLGQSADG